MSSENIIPTTIAGIKRLAKSIKASKGIQHARALDEAAHIAGFMNFSHARKVLLEQPDFPAHRFKITLAAHWHNRETNDFGRELLEISLTKPLTEIAKLQYLDNNRALRRYRPESDTLLEQRYVWRAQEGARESVCSAARTLHMMDVTLLRPSRAYIRVFPGSLRASSIPGGDHQSVWYDPQSKRYLLTDEPYEAAVANRQGEREQWARENGINIAKPSWPGMYYPDGGSRLYLFSDAKKGISLHKILEALNQLPNPVVASKWQGKSEDLMRTQVRSIVS